MITYYIPKYPVGSLQLEDSQNDWCNICRKIRKHSINIIELSVYYAIKIKLAILTTLDLDVKFTNHMSFYKQWSRLNQKQDINCCQIWL